MVESVIMSIYSYLWVQLVQSLERKWERREVMVKVKSLFDNSFSVAYKVHIF